MTVLFTPEELIQYLYQESSPEQIAAIESALQNDWTLREKMEVLKASVYNLDKIIESPRTESVLNVLRYARETAPAASV
jgi:hypothetical protein